MPQNKKILLNFADSKYKFQQNILNLSASPYFDEILSAGPHDIEEDFINDNKEIFNGSRGFGYWIWKSYFLKRTLQYINEGDTLMYVDSGNEFIANPKPLFELLDKQDLILFKNRDGNPKGEVWTNSMWTKSDCFALMGCEADIYKQGPQIDASYIIIKKTKKTVDFVDEYFKYSCNKNIITDLPNITQTPNEPDFKDHRHDQSILSLLAIKHNILLHESPSESSNHIIKDYPQIFNHFRRNPHSSQTLTQISSHPISPNKYVILATNSHPDYIYYLPIVTQAWNKLGYKTICLLMDDDKVLTDFVLKNVNLDSNQIVNLSPIKDIPNSSLVQVSRIFASSIPTISSHDLIITSDIDMIPLSDEYFNNIKKEFIFNILDAGELNYNRHKICYVAARKHHWVEMMGIKTNDINLELKNFFKDKANLDSDYYWNVDELYLFEKLSSSPYYPFSNFVDRGSNYLNFRNYRIDRGNIESTLSLYSTKAYDCHSIKSPFTNFSTLSSILKILFTEREINNFKSFTQEFNELLRRKHI